MTKKNSAIQKLKTARSSFYARDYVGVITNIDAALKFLELDIPRSIDFYDKETK